MAGKSKSSSVKYGGVLAKYAEFLTMASEVQDKPKIKIGPLSLNSVLGSPDGVPMGKLIQFVGRQSSGKSTLALDTIATYQRDNEEVVLYIDFERSFDPDYAAACGVDLNRLIKAHPDTTEQGMNIIQAALEEDITRLVIIDSVPAAMPASEVDKTYEDNARMSGTASIVTRFCQRSVGLIDNKNATIILINQFRKSMSTLSREDEVPAGGLALAYASSVIIYLTKIKTEENRQTVQALVRKNKVSRPQGRVEFFIDYGIGINHGADILTLAQQYGIIEKSGAWYAYNEYKAQGLEKAILVFPLGEIKSLVIERLSK